jgi:hypothetical protein
MTAEEWADKVYEATGMVVNAEQAFAISRLIMDVRVQALEDAWAVIADRPVNEDGLTFHEIMNRDQEMMDAIMELKKSSHV